MVTDFLTSIREHFERTIRKQIVKSALDSTPIEYIVRKQIPRGLMTTDYSKLTVPAVWTNAAQSKTRACAEKAGMGKGSALHMISEPEAAAVHALHVSTSNDLKVGDTIILCDAGGGTCDLISYTVLALKPTLNVTEASPGSGSLCGGNFLNLRFKDFLEKKYANEPGWDEDVLEEVRNKLLLPDSTADLKTANGQIREDGSEIRFYSS